MENESLFIKMQMDHKQVCKEIDKINQYLGKYQWMDFRYGYIGEDKIILYGCIDVGFESNSIEIIFEYHQSISSKFSWSLYEKKPFILLSTSEELYNNTKLSSERGGYVFKMNDELSEDYQIFITASGIKCNILKN